MSAKAQKLPRRKNQVAADRAARPLAVLADDAPERAVVDIA